MPFDASLITKISPLIDGQVPDFVQSDHPKFVLFLKQYYQFLEAAELIVDGIINNIILEKTDTQYLLNEDGTKLVTESGVGTTGKFVVGETITGGISNATAEVLVDDLENTRLFISSQQKFELGETITGSTSAATASIVSYRANPVATIQKLLDYANPDNTVSVMLDEMFNQFMQSIPNSLASGLSKRNLIKNIKDLYAAKGTSEGHKLFLRMLFGEEADIFYPTKRMLRLSDGNWNKKTVIRCENQAGSNGSEVIGQILTGQTSGTTCFVLDALVFTQGADSITEFQILQSSIQGTFTEGETLKADTVISKVEMKFTIQKIITGSIINKAGILHSSGDIITLDSSIGNNEAIVQVDQVSLGSVDEVIIDDVGSNYIIGDVLTFTTSELSTLTAAGFVSVVGGSPLLESNDNSDGYNDYLTLESYGRFIDSYGTENDRIVFEEGTPSTVGEITRIFLTDKGSGYSTLPTVSITSTSGTSAKLIPTTKNIGNILSTKNIDSGFNYESSASTSVASNFILKDITGSFVAGAALTSSGPAALGAHVGTVSNWDTSIQTLTTTIEDVVRVELEASLGSGVILLNATDSDGTDAGSTIVGESDIDFVGATISTAAASGTIIAANVPKIIISNGFIFTDNGSYNKNTDSHISEDIIRIQDGYFYQDFSYEVRIGQSLSTYINELKKAVHPAGFAPFGKITITTLISVAIPDGIGTYIKFTGGLFDSEQFRFDSSIITFDKTILA